MTESSDLITRLEFIADNPVIDEERQEVCDLAVEAIRDLERRLAASQRALTGDHAAFLDILGCRDAEIAALKQWIDDLQSRMYVNCVYCGHRYGPGETTPVSMADALKAHVEQCPKHPMSALKQRLEQSEKDDERMREALRVIVAQSLYEWSETRSELHNLIQAQIEVAAGALASPKGAEPPASQAQEGK